MLKEIAALYGLDPETATEADVLAAAKAAQEKAAALEKRMAEIEKGQLTAEAEQAYEANKACIKNKDAFVAAYVANKDGTINAMSMFFVPAPSETVGVVPNKSKARPPAAWTGGIVRNRLQEYNDMPEGKEKVKFLRAHAQEINDLREQTQKNG